MTLQELKEYLEKKRDALQGYSKNNTISDVEYEFVADHMDTIDFMLDELEKNMSTNQFMKKLVIMRGLPGSGKSTRAKELAGDTGLICSADDYFFKDGKYQFDSSKLKDAHLKCLNRVAQAMENSRDLIILDNTNTKGWEFKKYLELAREYGYQTQVEMVGNLKDVELYAQRNIHGVPLATIQRMATRFEE